MHIYRQNILYRVGIIGLLVLLVSTFSLSLAQQQHVLEIGELLSEEKDVNFFDNRRTSLTTIHYTPQDTTLSTDPSTPFYARTYTSSQSTKVTIEYDIAAKRHVKVEVYDVSKTYAKTLVNTRQDPGNYKVYFDGAERDSGLYICKITVNGKVWVEPMLLIK